MRCCLSVPNVVYTKRELSAVSLAGAGFSYDEAAVYLYTYACDATA